MTSTIKDVNNAFQPMTWSTHNAYQEYAEMKLK